MMKMLKAWRTDYCARKYNEYCDKAESNFGYSNEAPEVIAAIIGRQIGYYESAHTPATIIRGMAKSQSAVEQMAGMRADLMWAKLPWFERWMMNRVFFNHFVNLGLRTRGATITTTEDPHLNQMLKVIRS